MRCFKKFYEVFAYQVNEEISMDVPLWVHLLEKEGRLLFDVKIIIVTTNGNIDYRKGFSIDGMKLNYGDYLIKDGEEIYYCDEEDFDKKYEVRT